mgnify:CR=1 FL=1
MLKDKIKLEKILSYAVLLVFTLAVVGILIFFYDGDNVPAINESENIVSATPIEKEETTPTKEADQKEPEFVLPQKGVRPFAVMIDNAGNGCLPQGGLYKAQIIYEIIVEGGVSRLMPVFWGELPELTGPVRSSRHYFLDYVLEHDAIYVHFGWSPQAKNDISVLGINNINGVGYGGEVYWDITKDRRNWQDSYTSGENIENFLKKAKYRRNTDKELVFDYNEEEIELVQGQNATKIDISYGQYYKCGFTYDSESKMYLRMREGKPHIERITNEQLDAKNIIIQFAKNHLIPGDLKGRQEVYTVGTGNGWYITNGKAVEITWSKNSRDSKTQYFYDTGDKVSFNKGKTWIQIVPLSGSANIE